METIFDLLKEYILVIDSDRQLVYCNQQVLSSLKYTRKDYNTIQKMLRPLNDVLDTSISETIQTELILYDTSNEAVRLSVKINKQLWYQQEAYIVIGTELEELYYTKKDLENLLDNIPYHIWIKNLEGSYLYTNKHYRNLINPSGDKFDVLGTRALDYWSGKIAKEFTRIEEEFKEGKSSEWVEYNVEINGEPRTFETYKGIILDDNRQLKGSIGIGIDITSHRRIEESLQLETMKNEFFANISHEFKTPINIILATIQLVMKNTSEGKICSSEDVDIDRYNRLIKQNSYRLLKLVGNIIDRSKIDAGYYKLKVDIFNVINVIEEITLSVAQYMEHKGVNLIFDTDIEECIIACDAEKIERIMLNLLSNAIKYTKDNGEIVVKIVRKEDCILVSVQDNGMGIPEEKLELIFERFGQVSNADTQKIEGSGIGLSLVKSLVNMQGGKIWVESKLGKGSKFTFEIPIIDEQNHIDEEIKNKLKMDYVEQCHIEFADIYS